MFIEFFISVGFRILFYIYFQIINIIKIMNTIIIIKFLLIS